MGKIFKLFSLFIIVSLTVSSCGHQPEPDNQEQIQSSANGLYILNQGLMNFNNSTISFYNTNSHTVTPHLFLNTNNRGLGDTGNDLQIYGSKMYCVVNISETVEVINSDNCRSIKQISLQGKSPRRIAFHEKYGYVSCFDGSIIKIDTTTLEVVATQRAGRNPEGLCVANGKLYVANSGGLDFPNYDNTISVFDLATFTPIKTIEVVCNPCIAIADEDDVYIISMGNYGDIVSTLQKIDSENDEVSHVFSFPASNIFIDDDYGYIYFNEYTTQQHRFMVVDLDDKTIVNEQLIKDGTKITTPSAIFVHPITKEIFIADAGNYTSHGDVYCFSPQGNKLYSLEAGINPSNIVVKRAR